VNYDNDREKFMEFSQDWNKQILAEDNELIENYIGKSGLEFHKTSYGFWISNSGNHAETMAESGDLVKYEFEVLNFNDQTIYSKTENGEQTAMLGRTDIPRGVHIALELIEKGDSATVLFPSFMVYGGYGDRKKIGGNEPLIYKIHMLDIQKNKR
jgi:gliding motility-associated peptidyl-prolyl isomerase